MNTQVTLFTPSCSVLRWDLDTQRPGDLATTCPHRAVSCTHMVHLACRRSKVDVEPHKVGHGQSVQDGDKNPVKLGFAMTVCALCMPRPGHQSHPGSVHQPRIMRPPHRPDPLFSRTHHGVTDLRGDWVTMVDRIMSDKSGDKGVRPPPDLLDISTHSELPGQEHSNPSLNSHVYRRHGLLSIIVQL